MSSSLRFTASRSRWLCTACSSSADFCCWCSAVSPNRVQSRLAASSLSVTVRWSRSRRVRVSSTVAATVDPSRSLPICASISQTISLTRRESSSARSIVCCWFSSALSLALTRSASEFSAWRSVLRIERQHLALREVAEPAVQPLECALRKRDQVLERLGAPPDLLRALHVFARPDLGPQHEVFERRDSRFNRIDARRRLAHLFGAGADLVEHLGERRRALLEARDHARDGVGAVSFDGVDQALEALTLDADADEELLVSSDLGSEGDVALTSELRKEFHRCSGAGCVEHGATAVPGRRAASSAVRRVRNRGGGGRNGGGKTFPLFERRTCHRPGRSPARPCGGGDVD